MRCQTTIAPKSNFLITALIFLTLSLTSFSQVDVPTKISPELISVKDVFNLEAFDKINWELYARHGELENAPIEVENVIADIDGYLSIIPSENRKSGDIKEFELIKKYRNNLDSMFQDLKLLGRDQLGRLFYYKGVSIPIHFALYNDTALSLIIPGFFIDNVYNTVKLTSRQRATKVITTYILSSLKAFADHFTGSEIKYFGITCVYGSKDFSDRDILATKAEFVGFAVATGLVTTYVSGNITEDELVNGADIYISDRDMSAGIKKIKITLE